MIREKTRGSRKRLLLLGLILLAFARTVTLLDFKNFWWDESLSLQRAQESLPDLLRGALWLDDGITRVLTIDQHPFFSFLLQGILVRLAGDSEYVVRFVSVAAATLFVPALWLLARWLARHAVVPSSTPWWAAILAAINPFMLWYGQEARPYALLATLAILTTYLLLRTTENKTLDWRFGLGFVVVELMFLTTHYYAVFLLPLQALIGFRWLLQRGLGRAVLWTTLFLMVGSLIGLYGAYTIITQGGGQNFPSITLAILIPDLVNAFSLGLSVDLAVVWGFDLIFAALALGGAIYGLRSVSTLKQGGWILPAFVLVPVILVLLLNEVRPLYMNARHLSLLVGGFVLLVASGLALVWQWRRWAGALVAFVLVLTIGYSTVNYFTMEQYAKDDYTGLGDYLRGRIMPGDAVLFYPPSSWRIFDYYLPLDPVRQAMAQGAPFAIYGAPLLNQSMAETEAWLRDLGDRYDRIWVIKSGTHPYFDLDSQVESWLRDNFVQLRDVKFFSNSSLRAQLYLPKAPVSAELPAGVQFPVTVEFDHLIRLAGLSADPPVAVDLPAQMRLYWQVLQKPDRRYKYIISLVEELPDGTFKPLATTEHEPFEGDVPTTVWDPDKTIIESVPFPPLEQAPTPGSRLGYTIQMYDAETLVKLPVTKVSDNVQMIDDDTPLLITSETE
ncbi:MAG: glycosyltransferase family 39 protein [Anaerolineales bacterium]|nr:glycosyltransferase family 39 protein [Anaerolineales bacterium]